MEAIAIRLEAIATRLGAIATSNKDATHGGASTSTSLHLSLFETSGSSGPPPHFQRPLVPHPRCPVGMGRASKNTTETKRLREGVRRGERESTPRDSKIPVLHQHFCHSKKRLCPEKGHWAQFAKTKIDSALFVLLKVLEQND